MKSLPLHTLSCLGYDRIVAERLFLLGARPPVVQAVCLIGKKAAIRLYKLIHQRSPKQGMLPYDPFWVVRSAVYNIHASVFLGLVHDLCQYHQLKTLTADVLITAYDLYGRVVANNPSPSKLEASADHCQLLCINRAWQQAGQFFAGELALVFCTKCQARHVVIAKLPKPFQQCPICEVWADNAGRRRWMTPKARLHGNHACQGTV
jgi:hypothetical protein